MEVDMFEESEVREVTLEYFNGDELATNVLYDKVLFTRQKREFHGEISRRHA